MFLWSAFISPEGCAVGFLFATLIWAQVGVQALRDRAAERAHLAELNAALADMPAPEKTLYRPHTMKEPHRAA